MQPAVKEILDGIKKCAEESDSLIRTLNSGTLDTVPDEMLSHIAKELAIFSQTVTTK